ncbi:MAG: hypothetical protein F6K09_20800, partial [Merismopedia sp. SIO2A8]|nr:hypothetical protein [Merismopedia sp. SIO2A8]
MDYKTTILTFHQFIQDWQNFDEEALQGLPQLEQTLSQLSNDQFDPIADAIFDWCKDYSLLRPKFKSAVEFNETNGRIPKNKGFDRGGIITNISKEGLQDKVTEIKET